MTEQRFKRVVSFGSALVDIMAFLPALPPRGGDVLATDALESIGAVLNIETASARMGLPTVHAGSIGDGPHSQELLKLFANEGIEFGGHTFAGKDLGFCFTMVEPDGERTFVTHSGAEAYWSSEHLANLKLRPTDAVYLAGYDMVYPTSRQVLTDWLLSDQLNGAALFFDPGPLVSDLAPEVVEYLRSEAFCITANEREFEVMPSLATDRALFVRRLGSGGSEFWECGQLRAKAPGTPVTPVDSTGAGDVHTGTLIAMLAAGKSWAAALEIANSAAAYCVQRRGGTQGPTLEQLGL